jgi:hypothetical protein
LIFRKVNFFSYYIKWVNIMVVKVWLQDQWVSNLEGMVRLQEQWVWLIRQRRQLCHQQQTRQHKLVDADAVVASAVEPSAAAASAEAASAAAAKRAETGALFLPPPCLSDF